MGLKYKESSVSLDKLLYTEIEQKIYRKENEISFFEILIPLHKKLKSVKTYFAVTFLLFK